MDNAESGFMSAVELARKIRARQLSPVELVQAFLERISRLNPLVNAYCTLTPELALEQAREAETAIMRGEKGGLLMGIPVSIKDLIVTRGIRTTRGALLYENWVPEEDAPTVERVKAAGGIILGKTNTPEFGWRGSTDNRVFGPTRNPWNLKRTAGGSSGGASAQVAAGLGPLAIGTDGGGSIRIPASYTGIFGLKPTQGIVPVYPASGLGDISHAGPMSRTVADSALFLDVLGGYDERDRHSVPVLQVDYLAACEQGVKEGLKGLRVAWSPTLGYATVDPEVRQITEQAALRFSELGAEVEQEDPGFSSPLEIFNIYFYGGLAATIAEYRPDREGLLDPGLLKAVEKAQRATGLNYGRALIARSGLWDTTQRFFQKYDLLLTPTMPQTAFEVGLYGPPEARGLDWTPFTYPFNLTGQPAATVPCGFSAEGLPVGLQIVGRRFADALVLRASAAFEALQPWHNRKPAGFE